MSLATRVDVRPKAGAPLRRPRVLAAVVVPPHLTVSGGARAAEQLTAALAPHCDMSIASMMNGAGAGLAEENGARRLAVRSWRPSGVPWSRLPNHYGTLFYRSSMPEMVARGEYDLVHLHNPMPALELERVAKACQARGIPYVVSTHGFNEVANGEAIYGFGPAKREVWRRLVVAPVARTVRRAAGVFALSEADLDIVAGLGFRGKASIVCNGVALPPPANPEADRAALARLGLPPRKDPRQPVCMFLANHTPNKGLPNLLEAFARLRSPYLLVVGGEKRGGVDYERYARACGEGQRLLVTGRLRDDEVGALYRCADLFVFPTLADTFPLAVLEAMAHGTPVLASRVGGIPFQVPATCGELVAPGDAGELAAAADRLLSDPARLGALGRNARATVIASYTWEKAAQQALDGYRRALPWLGSGARDDDR